MQTQTSPTYWWIVLYESADGTRSERQLPATDKADARRYFLANLTGDDAWRGVRVLSITRFADNAGVAF